VSFSFVLAPARQPVCSQIYTDIDTSVWNARPRFERDASADEKREGGEGKVGVHSRPWC
jgi:hypothetical protein